MREIRIVHLDKARPALLLTREAALRSRNHVTVAPITSTRRGLFTEVEVGVANGLEDRCVVSVDNIMTVANDQIGRHVGYLTHAQERDLARAIVVAFDLDIPIFGLNRD